MTDAIFVVGSDSNDGRCEGDGSNFYNSWPSILIGHDGSVVWVNYLRFTNITIPPGSIITDVYLHLRAYNSLSGTTVYSNIWIEDADNPGAPSTGSDLLTRLASAQGPVAWDNIAAWINNTWYDSPSFISLLQDHIDRAGWESGFSINIIIEDDGSDSGAYREGSSRYWGTASDPELHVSYTSPPLPDINDQIAISESQSLLIEFIGELNNFEDIAAIESIQIELEDLPEPSVFDQLVISENIQIGLDKQISIDEALALSENFAVELYSFLHEPQSGDDIALSEYIETDLEQLIEPQAAENIALTESAQIDPLELKIDVGEDLALTEFVLGAPILAETAEAIQVSDLMESFNWSIWFAANKYKSISRYFMTLTGEADATTDFTIPISSFQARKRTDNPTYISATIPSFNYAEQIQDRANGEIIITLGYEISGTIEFEEEILRATIEEIRPDEGGESRAITISGSKTQSFINQVATILNPIYRSIQSGNIVYRFAQIDPWVNPGDTCIVGEDTFTIDYIIYMVNSYQTVMEIREG